MSLPPGFVLDSAPTTAAPRGGPVYGPPPKPAAPPAPPTPFQVEDQQFQREDQQAQREAQERERIRFEAEYDPATGRKRPNGGAGRPLPDATTKRIEAGIGAFSSLVASQAGFNDEYAGNTITGGAENTIQGMFSDFGTPGQRDWWANFRTLDNQIRNDLFGATLTPSEQAAYASTTIDPSMDPAEIKRNLDRRVGILRDALSRQQRFMVANNFDEDAVNILYEPLANQAALQGEATMGEGVGGGPPPGTGPSPWDNPETRVQGVTGEFQRKDDPRLAGVREEYLQRLMRGESAGTIIPWLRERGVDPSAFPTVLKQIDNRRKRPGDPSSTYGTDQLDDMFVPLSATEQGINTVAQSPAGAAAIGAGNFLSGNNLDSIHGALGGDPEEVRRGLAVSEALNPNATMAGEVVGGVLTAVTGEGLLARAGMAPGLLRATAADAAMGAANGAGAADGADESRLVGAATGAGVATLGSLVGDRVARGIGSTVSPTGGSLRQLYDEGVRPTVGQRVVEAGGGTGFRSVAGRAVNATEEALQSVPVIGPAIRGARQESRDQFQTGAFNQALREIGETLPDGVTKGPAAQAFMQNAFNQAYAKARGAMRVVADEDLDIAIAQLAPDISTLGPAALNKLKAIMRNGVNNKMRGGVMDGAGYISATSTIGKHIQRLRKSTSAEEQQLADVLEGVDGALGEAARRHSPPEAIAALDAADAGYAKAVRIEGAAARRGGDQGEFSPANFDSEVQRASGGVRSRAYLRGDALMQDYARAGRSLEDRLPNSGTADRVMAGYAVGTPVAGGAAYMEPATAAVLGAIGLGYAPGVRKLAKGAMAPSSRPVVQAIGKGITQRKRVAGALGAAYASERLADQ